MSAAMEIIKVLFLISMAASLSTSKPKLLGLQESGLPPRQSEVAHPTKYDDCYCPTFNANSVLISAFLGRNAADFERVVVYFYKNKATNKLIMYTPSKDKQRQIPDPPYDAGDNLLTIGTETVVELYENTLHNMSELHHNTKTLPPTNSYRLTDYTTSSGSVPMNPTPHADIMYFQSSEPDVDWAQLGVHDDQDSTEYFNKIENEVKSPFSIPKRLKRPSYNFNDWFAEQLKQLPELADASNEFIDPYSLKTRIVKILRDHDFNLVNDYAFDEHGNILEMTNLQLLEITIDEKVTNVRDEWSPVHIEGLMLVHLNPRHILGVVPLKKSLLVSSHDHHHHTPAQRIVPEKTSTGYEHVNDIYDTNGSSVGLLEKVLNLETTSSPVVHHVTPEDVLVSESSKNPGKLNDDDTTQVNELVEDIIRTFGKYYNSDKISQVVKHLLDKPNGTSGADVPEYRIIGGHAALQSGSPLNYKARSAYNNA